ncbi:hypothetical protein KZZ52_31285 [Dactylosporangium sp. AC04546]|uniref:hypothetical protein n=1 Tax=Dactylosporangium sp. AC04546 TaxID=2862460 RepID=UPI001EDD11D3|nr:hypothetical protein [Dactylosporangium sp. AC04546]WVK78477.1 hypothetical protein KZZ52_31285 [Dactylosporangium sp. AC04546]
MELTETLRRELAALGPAGWRRLDAVFTVTTVRLAFTDERGHVVHRQPTAAVVELARAERHASARPGAGPWWRLLVTLDPAGAAEVVRDDGDEPFPDGDLAPPEVYRADLAAYPRDRLPLWLAAHVAHEDRQARPAGRAAAQARQDRRSGTRGTPSAGEFPEFPVMWARWAAMAAGFVAARSSWGPRMLPGAGRFEGSRRSGSTLYQLPGGRAVLSGGVWNAPELPAPP